MLEKYTKNRAELYDLEYPPNFYGDLDFIHGFACRTCSDGGSILDLGAGTGRVGIHLLRRGFNNITMVDNDSSMIMVIKRKLAKQFGPRDKSGVEIIYDSMETPIKNKNFSLIIVTGNTFTSLLSKKGQYGTLENIKGCLSNSGLAIIHISTPCIGRDFLEHYEFTFKFRIPNSSYICHRYVKNEFSADRAQITFNFLYKVYEADLFIGEFCNSVTTKIVSHGEMKKLIETIGLKIITVNKGFTNLYTQEDSDSRVYIIGKSEKL